MREYQIYYKSGDAKEFSCEGRADLINKLFDGDEEKLIEEVKLLKWETSAMFFSEDPATGKVDSQITTADSNPYGWRNEGDLDKE